MKPRFLPFREGFHAIQRPAAVNFTHLHGVTWHNHRSHWDSTQTLSTTEDIPWRSGVHKNCLRSCPEGYLEEHGYHGGSWGSSRAQRHLSKKSPEGKAKSKPPVLDGSYHPFLVKYRRCLLSDDVFLGWFTIHFRWFIHSISGKYGKQDGLSLGLPP